jgi:outer membrane protein assembly factor BamB
MNAALARPKLGMFTVAALAIIGASTPLAEDWPDFRGRDRTGIVGDSGLIDRIPAEGLPVVWRVPVGPGFSSPTIANGRVFVLDMVYSEQLRLAGTERLLALDEKTGKILWKREWPASYAQAHIGIHENGGPVASATVDGDRVYAHGRAGMMIALNANTGDVLWSRDFLKEYNADFGCCGASTPATIEGPLLIAYTRGKGGPAMAAYDKMTGKEVWRTGKFRGGPAPPILINAGGRRQLIVRHDEGVASFDPTTGEKYWEQPFRSPQGEDGTIAPAVYSPPYLIASDVITGSLALKLDDKTPTASVAWKSQSDDNLAPDTLNAEISPVMVKDGYLYGICAFGQLRCLRLATGQQIWETQKVTKERTRFVTAFIVRSGDSDRYFILNDRGELVLAKLTPEGYEELGRTTVIKPTTEPGNRRQLTYVQWSHPSYANRRLYVRNNEEIVAYSLAAASAPSDAARQVATRAGNRAPDVRESKTASANVASATSASTKSTRLLYLAYSVAQHTDPGLRTFNGPLRTANLYVLTGEEHHTVAIDAEDQIVLIDTKSTPQWGAPMMRRLEAVTSEQVGLVVETNVHQGGSNAEFPKLGAVIAHENTKKRMAKLAGVNAKAMPTKTFQDKLSVPLKTIGTEDNSNRVDLLYFGPGYTDGDAVVVMPQYNAVYLGELYPGKSVPLIDRANGGSALRLPETLDKAVAKLKTYPAFQMVIPSRETPPATYALSVREWNRMKHFEEYVAFTHALVDVSRAAHEAKKTVDAAVAEFSLPDRFKGYSLDQLRPFVQAVYDELR